MEASGVVLAGGASRRMGRDKAVLPFEGQRLIDRAVGRLQQVAEDVVVASGRRRIRGLAVPQVADHRGGGGPLNGLTAGLMAVRHDLACVLAVDLPHAEPTLFKALIDRWEGEAALIPSAGGKAQPLHAVWASTAVASLSLLVADGVRSVVQAAQAIGATVLDDEQTMALVGHDRWALNLNAPSDLPDLPDLS
ncbi:MAG TPA: molybdenum cofactor guanylyltransferase [Euzebya sp.]|nr:molybdenum cofactor guanylyltransferase [Euzebya sp.]